MNPPVGQNGRRPSRELVASELHEGVRKGRVVIRPENVPGQRPGKQVGRGPRRLGALGEDEEGDVAAAILHEQVGHGKLHRLHVCPPHLDAFELGSGVPKVRRGVRHVVDDGDGDAGAQMADGHFVQEALVRRHVRTLDLPFLDALVQVRLDEGDGAEVIALRAGLAEGNLRSLASVGEFGVHADSIRDHCCGVWLSFQVRAPLLHGKSSVELFLPPARESSASDAGDFRRTRLAQTAAARRQASVFSDTSRTPGKRGRQAARPNSLDHFVDEWGVQYHEPKEGTVMYKGTKDYEGRGFPVPPELYPSDGIRGGMGG